MDRIIIKDAVYPCILGVTKEEQSTRQTIILDIIIHFDAKKPGLSDSIKDTIDYSDINMHLKKMLDSKSFCLIERIAEEVSGTIMQSYLVNKVEVCVKKPSAIRNADYAAVSIERERK
jgi:FolB domain-containing protein